MFYRNVCFSLIALLSVGGFAHTAWAVPAVKRLGVANNNYVQNNNVATPKNASLNSSNLSRTSSIRTLGTAVKPANVAKPTKTADKSGANIDDRRLTVGKYIHTSGVNSGYIKPIGNTTEPQVSSDDFVNLTDRVIQLEKTKQDNLSAGGGIEIENNVISVSTEIQELPDAVADINEQLNEKVDIANITSNYYTKDEVYTKNETQQFVTQHVQNVVENITGQDVDTIYDAADGERKYVSIVDEFNPDVLR